ncbi:hypothetical protein Btru_023549 [Bulinus truncatus]|nr:hypothetical protein Btru_023549 [Bulinus truncatus]
MAASLLSIQGVTTAPVNQQRPLPPVPRKCYAQEISVNITSAEITDNARTISEKAPPSALGQHDHLAITTSPHQRAHIQKEKNISAPSLLCCLTRKYAKVTEAFPKRKNMSWLLRKRTLLAFSTMSLVFSLFSCGLLLCLKLRPLFDSHDRMDPTCPKDNRTDSELRNLSVTGSMCYENRQKLSEIIEDGLARKGIKHKTSERLINGSECSLTVQTTGWFFVYSSVTVNVTNCTATKQWSHVIVHLPKSDSLTNRTLTQSVRTCCSDCPNYVETSFTGGIYRLEDGDDVFVRLDLPSTGSSNQTCISLVNVGRG